MKYIKFFLLLLIISFSVSEVKAVSPAPGNANFHLVELPANIETGTDFTAKVLVSTGENSSYWGVGAKINLTVTGDAASFNNTSGCTSAFTPASGLDSLFFNNSCVTFGSSQYFHIQYTPGTTIAPGGETFLGTINFKALNPGSITLSLGSSSTATYVYGFGGVSYSVQPFTTITKTISGPPAASPSPSPSPTATYTISGEVFLDTNASGTKDSTESNWSVGTLNVAISGNGIARSTALTAGSYTFSGLSPGNYTLSLSGASVGALNLYQIRAGGSVVSTGTTSSVTIGSSSVSVGFGLYEIPTTSSPSPSPAATYTISGKIFKDDDGDGFQSPACSSTVTTNCEDNWKDNAKQVTVTLLDKDSGATVNSKTTGSTDALASYSFANLSAGNYQLRLTSNSTDFSLSNYSIKPINPKDVPITSSFSSQPVNFGLQPLTVTACPADIVSTQVRFKNNPPAANEQWVTSKIVKLGQPVRVTAFHIYSSRSEQTSDVEFTVTGPDGLPVTLLFPSPPPGATPNEIVFTPTIKGAYLVTAARRARSGNKCQGTSTLTVESATTTGYIISEDRDVLQAIITAGNLTSSLWQNFTGSPLRRNYTFTALTIGQRKTVYAIFKNSNSEISRIFEATITYIGSAPTISNVKCTYADGRGTIVTITGANFGQKGPVSLVTVGTKAAAIDEWTSSVAVSSPSPAPSVSPAPSAPPAGSSEDQIVARVNERLTTQTLVVVKVNDGRTVTSGCAVDLTSVSFIGRTQCRAPGNFAADNVNVIIVEVAASPSNEQCDGVKRPEGCACSANNQCVSNKCENSVCVVKHEPIFNQKIKLDQAGKPQGFAPNIEKNKTYALIVKAPKTVSKKQEFLAEEGTSNFEMSLSVGDIAPIDLPDGKINSLDRSRLVSEWVLTKDVANRLADFNGDNRVNSVDWSCMRMNFNKSDETVGDIKPVAPASSLSSPTPSVLPSPSPRGSASPSPSPSPVSDTGVAKKLKIA